MSTSGNQLDVPDDVNREDGDSQNKVHLVSIESKDDSAYKRSDHGEQKSNEESMASGEVVLGGHGVEGEATDHGCSGGSGLENELRVVGRANKGESPCVAEGEHGEEEVVGGDSSGETSAAEHSNGND